MPPQIPDRALDVWAVVTPEVQITVVVAIAVAFGVWLWHRVIVKRLEVMPDRRSSGVPPEVLTGILEEMSRNQVATNMALEHLARAVDSLRELVNQNRCSYERLKHEKDKNCSL